jgi:hypothetical protein
MRARFFWFSLAVLAAPWLCDLRLDASEAPGKQQIAPPEVVRRAEINPNAPIFVPVHPRIATTVSFPRPIGEPMGTGFVEADAFQKALSEGKTVARGDYVITFTQGETFFTVQPISKSEVLNLNVPYEGATVVLYFYVVDEPLSALASLVLTEKGGATPRAGERRATASPEGETAGIQRSDTPPESPFLAATPARLDGLLRKLRLIHAARVGPELEDIAAAMNVKVAVSSAENPDSVEIAHPVNAAPGFELILLRAVRDPKLDSVGFIVLFRNLSDAELVFDLRTLAARCGAALYSARVVDAPASLKPKEVRAGYFVVVGSSDDRPGYLLPANDWRLSVAVVGSPSPMGEKEEGVP